MHEELLLIMEYMPGGSLYQAIHKHSETLSWVNGWAAAAAAAAAATAAALHPAPLRPLHTPTACSGQQVAIDVARGLAHLHSRGIIHMDVKSAVGGSSEAAHRVAWRRPSWAPHLGVRHPSEPCRTCC
jgi:serine/threonine protein kinase